MDVLERLARGIGRTIELVARLAGTPKLLVVLIVGVVLLAYRHNSRAPELRERHKDPGTLVGLCTVRLLWWWRAPVAAVVATGWLVAQGLGWVAVLAVLGLVAVRLASRPLWERWAASERRHQWAARWAWRWLWSCFQADVLGRERWGVQSPYPTVKAVEVRGENAALTVRIPPKLDLASLARHEGQIGAQLRVKGLRVLPSPSGDMGLARVEVLNRVLAPGRRLDEFRSPHADSLLIVGFGFDGAVHFDLDNEVGLGIFGATGAGKGVLARWLAVQAIGIETGMEFRSRYRELWLIDPQSSGEWAPFADVPGVRLLRYDPTRSVATLTAIVDALDELAVDVAARNELCSVRGVDAWRYLDADHMQIVPRRVLMVDEVSSLLAKVERSDPTRAAREAIGQRLGDSYRTARKAGVGFIHIDQASYQGDATYLAAGAIGQLGRWVALGGMRDETKRMVSGFTAWPYVASVPGLGLTGRRADEHPEPIEVPNVTRAQVEAALAGVGKTLAHTEVAR